MEDPLTLGFELTFLPRKRGQWQEYRDEDEAKRAAETLNAAFAKDTLILQAHSAECADERLPLFTAKADPFRVLWSPGQPHRAWCIEIHNQPIRADAILRERSAVSLALEAVYKHCRRLGLHPHIERRERDGTVLDFPTGGGHIHAGLTGFWKSGPLYLAHLRLLETSLCLDLANTPLIRWMFSQWSDDSNSTTDINRAICAEAEVSRRRKRLSRLTMVDWVHDTVLGGSSFKQRFTAGYKMATMFTWELRFFDMPRTVAELRLQVGFVNAWFGKRVQQIDAISKERVSTKRCKLAATWVKEVMSYRLTVRYWDKVVRNEGFAKEEMAAFLRRLDLDPQPYMDTFWARSYGRRRQSGTFA